jgi:hypothetical protein
MWQVWEKKETLTGFWLRNLKVPPARLRPRWKVNIKTDLTQIESKGMD